MTNGSAPDAGDHPNSSSSTPTDGPPSEPSTTEPETLPMDTESLQNALLAAFQQGWRIGQIMPDQPQPPALEFMVRPNPETRSVDIEVKLIDLSPS